jgi:hypothetical protein
MSLKHRLFASVSFIVSSRRKPRVSLVTGAWRAGPIRERLTMEIEPMCPRLPMNSDKMSACQFPSQDPSSRERLAPTATSLLGNRRDR